MNKNTNLNKAKMAKEDEFYTRREDIEAEVCNYAEHFKNKVVYCNCDDPTWSEFWQFFVRNFKPYGLKKLMATHYEKDEINYAYKLEITEDTNGDGRIDVNDEPTITQIPCNGDFRSASCMELLKEADVIVTNPPFSLIRDYIAQLVLFEKEFLIIAPLNAVKYKEIFPLIRDNRIWMGYTHPKEFLLPDGTSKKFGNVIWLTNLDIPKRHVNLDLRGNYYNSEKYIKYVNYDAIEVGKIHNIPCDYEGEMGVPISFLEHHNPNQFEIIGMNWSVLENAVLSDDIRNNNATARRLNFYLPIPDGKGNNYSRMYDRLVIRNRHPQERRYPDA